MEFGVLGPLAVWEDGREVPLGAPKQRAVLLLLLLRANELVPTTTLVDELWGERPPPRAVKAVQLYISQLRKALGRGLIETRAAGYLLRVDPAAFDLQKFEGLLERGRTMLATGAAGEASGLLRDALDLWRGPALADFRYESFARAEIGRLEELRLVALTSRLEADLALGRHAEAVPELEALIEEQPLRESLRGLLILALYRAGRQADALAAYHQARVMLGDELGLEPTSALRRLEKAILVQDPSLDLAVPARSTDGLPTGTVTFLFTDVEGSTELLDRLGSAEYAALLTEHRRLLRAVFADAGGREVDTQGDAFFVAFATAAGAIQAAVGAQRELAATQLWVRIGIHTGEPFVGPTGYVGLDVPRAARICAAAHGGQVLVSQSTRELVEAELPDGVGLRDLGEHRLKDLTRPQRLSQLLIDGLRSEFPSLRTLENRPTNLPTQPTALLGRARELAAITARLRRDDVHLLTLTGPGGAGKTRLGLQAAAELLDDFPQGVYLVSLAPLADAGLVVPTIAQTLGLEESGAATLAESLAAFVAEQRLLLVLDNFEHVIEEAQTVADLLAAAPQVKVLVTSRIPLHLAAEHELPVPPLGLPDPERLPEFTSLSQYEAVALFVERAQAVKADFEVTAANAPALAELCVRLDGLPLAIELAAARAKLLSPQALLNRFEQHLDLLAGGPRDRPARQQTLRATIDWSHELLGPEEQTLFARLAVFAGGCTLDAAEAVCGNNVLEGLSTLVDDNLLRQEEQPDGEPRFTMLETIRTYARERLQAAGETDEIRRRHADYFLAVDERTIVDPRFGEVDSLLLERDLDNFRAALTDLSARDERESIVRLVHELRFLWMTRGHLREGARWCDGAVELADELPRLAQARAWECAASFALRLDQVDRASELFRRALATRRGSEASDATEEAWTTRMLALIADKRGEYVEAHSLNEQAAAAFHALGNAKGLSVVLSDRAQSALNHGELARARPLLEERLLNARQLGFQEHIGSSLFDLGIVALHEGHHDDAAPLFVESLESAIGQGDRTLVALSLRGLAASAAGRGDLEQAARIAGAAETIDEQTGYLLEPYERKAFAEAMRPVAQRADEPAIAAAAAAGRAMTESAATAYALATVAADAPR